MCVDIVGRKAAFIHVGTELSAYSYSFTGTSKNLTKLSRKYLFFRNIPSFFCDLIFSLFASPLAKNIGELGDHSKVVFVDCYWNQLGNRVGETERGCSKPTMIYFDKLETVRFFRLSRHGVLGMR
jgi:hypothetical protein